MFFYISKLLWFFAAPSNLLVMLVVLGGILLRTRFARLGGRLALGGGLALLAIGILPISSLILLPLENRFPPAPADMPAPTGIIVLGGAIDPGVSTARGHTAMTDSGERQLEAAALALRYPNAKLVFTGGPNPFLHGSGTEAQFAVSQWGSLGIPVDRVIAESASRNTYENAILTRNLVQPNPGERWLLVTSAFHMPRSMGIFRKAGFPVEAYPVDYRTEGNLWRLRPMREVSDGLHRFDLAVREWVGLAGYYFTDKTDALFPGP